MNAMQAPVLREDADQVCYLTFNRVDKHNSFNLALMALLGEQLEELDRDQDVRVVVLRGAGGRAFSTGADLGEIVEADQDDIRRYNRIWIDLLRRVEMIPKPVIASVNGYAFAGGTELTLACDLVIAAQDSEFGLTEARVGVIPGAGACVRLPRWVGRAAAKELLMFGDPISATEAHRMGLVNRIVDADLLEIETAAWAMRLATRSPDALAGAKRAVNIGAELELEQGIEFALDQFAGLFDGANQEEGMRAFLERRTPRFSTSQVHERKGNADA